MLNTSDRHHERSLPVTHLVRKPGRLAGQAAQQKVLQRTLDRPHTAQVTLSYHTRNVLVVLRDYTAIWKSQQLRYGIAFNNIFVIMW